MSEKIIIADRIKESSYSSGTGNFELFGAFTGFSTFSSAYSYGDTLFYAITDGSSYEIGSGVFSSGVTNPEIVRFPLRSTNNNNLVSFGAGTKEVYVTYPATHAVYTGQGISGIRQPNAGGIAFWSSEHILNYDSNIVWDDVNKRLGINQQNPSYAIDIGGITTDSIVRASGFIAGESGVFFPAGNGYAGGTQLIHFEKNQLDQYAYDNALIPELTGTSSVFELSGVVNEFILFKQQNAGTFFAGPESGCISPCGPSYPYFRSIVLDDIPFVSDISGVLQTGIENIASDLNTVSGALRDDLIIASGSLRDDLIIASGALRTDLTSISGIAQAAYDASGILNSKIDTEILKLSGVLTQYTNSIYGFGNNTHNQIKPTRDIYESNNFHYPVLVSGINNVSGIFCSQSRSFILVNNNGSGELYAQGLDINGRIDGSDYIISPLKRIHPDKNWRSFSCGFSHNVGIDVDDKMYIWGENLTNHESIWGDEDVSRPNSTLVPIMEIGSGVGWSDVSCGTWFTLAISNSGYLYAWGDGEYVGQGNTGDISGVIQVGTRKWTQIAAGDSHSLAISSGELFGFGYNLYGELGPSGIGSLIPTPSYIPSYASDKIYAGENISSYIYNTNVYIFGRNNYGQLANGTKIDNSGTTNVGMYFNYLNAKDMSLGQSTIAIQTYDNELYLAGRIPDNEIFYEALYPKKLNFKNITHFDIDNDTGLFYAN